MNILRVLRGDSSRREVPVIGTTKATTTSTSTTLVVVRSFVTHLTVFVFEVGDLSLATRFLLTAIPVVYSCR